ncbi:MAG: TerC family protein [Castellaniella sp.]|uniref:TerC family protein n=1 Tax=Castellaniella sp. TaxID=1955812 RepID=UPI0012247FAC|nr:TerC family protein [Castellaniella sp.]TAN30947.1 MAG: TerC family protein [Castellaniella sp.]
MLEFLYTLHWGAVFQIVLIDVLLGGDNAVVIALACRKLEHRQRLQGILWGTVGAIALRIVLIAFALTLLAIPFLKVVGALLLLWIGVRLLLPDDHTQGNVHASATVLSAIRTIIVADLVMSLDNVVAIAGAAQNAHDAHQMGLVAFGLVLSVPIIVWGSTLVLRLIDRFPMVVTAGAGLLGWIAGGMLVTDQVFIDTVGTPPGLKIGAEIVGAVLVIAAGRLLARRRAAAAPREAA